MSRSILFRLFGLGKIPVDALRVIEQEGVILKEEGISGSITFRKFRGPGRYHGFRKSWICGSIVLTEKHLLAFQFRKTAIGVGWGDRQVKKLKCHVEGRKTLCIQYDAGDFNPDCSGHVTLRYNTESASKILSRIKKLIRQAKWEAS